jgi:hypothetical protein
MQDDDPLVDCILSKLSSSCLPNERGSRETIQLYPIQTCSKRLIHKLPPLIFLIHSL